MVYDISRLSTRLLMTNIASVAQTNLAQFIVYGINIVSKGNQLYKSTDGALI
jgi:hypothetical protein